VLASEAADSPPQQLRTIGGLVVRRVVSRRRLWPIHASNQPARTAQLVQQVVEGVYDMDDTVARRGRIPGRWPPRAQLERPPTRYFSSSSKKPTSTA
jgi:hypothetical protein